MDFPMFPEDSFSYEDISTTPKFADVFSSVESEWYLHSSEEEISPPEPALPQQMLPAGISLTAIEITPSQVIEHVKSSKTSMAAESPEWQMFFQKHYQVQELVEEEREVKAESREEEKVREQIALGDQEQIEEQREASIEAQMQYELYEQEEKARQVTDYLNDATLLTYLNGFNETMGFDPIEVPPVQAEQVEATNDHYIQAIEKYNASQAGIVRPETVINNDTFSYTNKATAPVESTVTNINQSMPPTTPVATRASEGFDFKRFEDPSYEASCMSICEQIAPTAQSAQSAQNLLQSQSMFALLDPTKCSEGLPRPKNDRSLAQNRVTKPKHTRISTNRCLVRGSHNPHVARKDFDYSDVKLDYIEKPNSLTNNFRMPISEERREGLQNCLQEHYGEEGLRKCEIQRTRYFRESISQLEGHDALIKYDKEDHFDEKHPYQHQWTRVEIDPLNGRPFNDTRAGLCAYCPDIKFYTIKNSNYAQHLACNHGVFPDNYLTPNPTDFGRYVVKKNGPSRTTNARERVRDAVICTCCYEIVEANCTTTTKGKRPLMNYLRHFRQKHRNTQEKDDEMKYFTRQSS